MVVLAALALSGCGKGGWFGEAEAPPLPGKRISVLSLQSKIESDPALSSEPVTLPPPAVNRDWLEVSGAADGALGHVAVNMPPKLVWRKDVGKGSDEEKRILSTPLVANGRIYVLDGALNLVAVSLADGKPVWKVDTNPKDEEDGFGGGIAYADGRIYVAAGYAQIVAYDAATGKEIWRHGVSGPVRSAPLVASGLVVATTVENRVEAYDAANGRPRWSYTGTVEPLATLGGGTPAYSQDVAVVPLSSGEVVALRIDNGRLLWGDSLVALRRTSEMAQLSDIHAHPILADGRAIVGSSSGRMAAIDMRTGGRVWEGDFGGRDTPWYAGKFLFVVSREGELVCAHTSDGRVRWVRNLPRYKDPEDKEDPISWAGPILAGGRLVLAGTNGTALLVSPEDGRDMGRLELPGPSWLPPIAVDGYLVFLTDNGELAVYR